MFTQSSILTGLRVAVWLCLLVVVPTALDLHACSTFFLKHDSVALFGKNLDIDFALPGLVVVNPRGLHNTAWRLPLGDDTPPMPEWISRYGSVAFTSVGFGFPDGGMNETGLVIEEMTLVETMYPVDSTKGALTVQQWIQYALDMCGSVDEVVSLADTSVFLPELSWPLHFLVADTSGDCVVIEFIAGSPVVYRGDSLRVACLTNNNYRESLKALGGYIGFGGDRPIPSDSECYSQSRFVKLAHGLHEYSDSLNAVAYAHTLLGRVRDRSTIRSIVYDMSNRSISFSTGSHETIKSVSLAEFDLACPAPVLVCDLEVAGEGSIREYFAEFSPDTNKKSIEALVTVMLEETDLAQLLSHHAVSSEEVIESINDHAETISCDTVSPEL